MVRKHKMANCYIPFEIQEDIMKRLPVKSLIQFRSVSKPWKSIIDSSKFIIDHSSPDDHTQYMLIRYNDPKDNFKDKYVSIVDNDTFPQHQFPVIVVSVTRLKYPNIGGYDQGLFCFYSPYMDKDKATIWNPNIRKSVDIDVPDLSPRRHYLSRFISFGVCRETKDPKLVKITYISYQSRHDNISSIPRQVEVFSLSTRVWRSLSINLPRLSIGFRHNSQVGIDGLIYWLAYNNNDAYYLIMSFDMTSENFTEIDFPIRLTVDHDIILSKLRDSLVVVVHEYSSKAHQIFYGVWLMENGIPKSFTKLYNIERYLDYQKEMYVHLGRVVNL